MFIYIIFYFEIQIATAFEELKTARQADRFVSLYKYTQTTIASCSWIAIPCGLTNEDSKQREKTPVSLVFVKMLK